MYLAEGQTQLSQISDKNFWVLEISTVFMFGPQLVEALRYKPEGRGFYSSFIIIIISNLSNDRSKATSKTIPPHSAI